MTEIRLHTDGGPLVWNATVHRDLAEAFTSVGLDESTKVVILTGTGEDFCASIDRASFREAVRGWDVTWFEGRRMLTSLWEIDVPVISAINGPALIHSELAVMADVVLACPTTVFADKAHFVSGVVPGDGVHIVWTELLGPTRGRYFLLTGTEIDAAEALRLGVVHEIHSPDALSTRAWELAADMARHPLPVLRYTRTALSMRWRRTVADELSHGLAVEGLGQYAQGHVARTNGGA
ncbi:enoyl-CoA hydratase/isomerase family protein [Mycobacterium sp. CVI_P3]|uniref:Enoyl-CoA hydratase/isomerase family protein n=1 Tax=Mycobacterium pinniadriaticum TaxID=2994102 RepID=A0ABT3SF20_9MYCO|nr:enoyl-CoA hydratase/isomerase family protein [Mycobacterium pinniadriaticum]MCX2931809.1 enoyl-CoA hydratase/isomerase family protein [Mycobacterium pinniadriaticum]MCX2938116.1 enoyl-CoA hydratase/isomerase family protein [Mycobacterium pinniadriaticum]